MSTEHEQEVELLHSLEDVAFKFKLVTALDRCKAALEAIATTDDAAAARAIARAALGESKTDHAS